MSLNTAGSKSRAFFTLALVGLYLAFYLYVDGLRVPPRFDEPHYWETSLTFSHYLIPSLESLRTYNELNTPLAFIIFGIIENLTHSGIYGGRLLNFILAFSVLLTIGLEKTRSQSAPILAVLGLLLCPYYLRLSAYLYTDMIAATLVFAGVWLYLKSRHWWAAAAFTLAIASRQYMIAFPAGIVLYEVLSQYPREGLRVRAAWLAPALAAATIIGWIVLFGGLAPQNAYRNPVLHIPSVQKTTYSLDPGNISYLLACIGIFYVIPDWLLFNRSLDWRSLINRRNIALAIALAVLMAVFPPLKGHGILVKVLYFARFYPLKMAIVYIPALMTLLRFNSPSLATALIFMNLAVLLKAYPWDKYLLPLYLVLWYFRAVAPELPRPIARKEAPTSTARVLKFSPHAT